MKTLKKLMEVLKENETRTESMGIQIIALTTITEPCPLPFRRWRY